ncbi:MAG: class I SAM-dependent methyltransferase [Ekhidna sp.]
MKDLHGKAILDYYQGDENASLLIHNNYDEPEEMPAEVFFRDELDFTTLENLALIECKGKVLDLGAGAGAHSLALQARGYDVTALEYSPGCIQVMQQSGVDQFIKEDYRKHLKKYDTLLVMMNGLGLAGTLANVPTFIKKCMSMLNPEGQLLIDSSDIRYLYESGIEKKDGYYGEVKYRYEYKKEKGDWFDWVYIDQQKLKTIIDSLGFDLEIMMTDENDQYLARIIQP